MNCWHCERPAHGNCAFCGRAVCRDHVKSLPRIIDIYNKGEDGHFAFVVNNALYCGVCKPREDPIRLERL